MRHYRGVWHPRWISNPATASAVAPGCARLRESASIIMRHYRGVWCPREVLTSAIGVATVGFQVCLTFAYVAVTYEDDG